LSILYDSTRQGYTVYSGAPNSYEYQAQNWFQMPKDRFRS
jgi:hypothetical protein